MIIKKDSKIVKAKVERKSIALKAKKESSNEERSTFEIEYEEYAIAVRDFKKFFKRRARFVRQPRNDKKTFQRSHDEEDDEKVKNKMCLIAQASSEICLGVDLKPDDWIKDSRCSKQMTGNRKVFSSYKAYNGGTKWVFRNKLDENSIVSQNKARILLAYAYALDFKLFQMDVKSAFLNGFINEEVYVAQPPGFIDFEKPNHVYKLKKALYGLKQAPKAWPDIMFSVCLCACFQEAPKNSHLEAVKCIFRHIKGTTHLGLCYPMGTGIEIIVYADSDHAGDCVDRKSTSGICTFVGCCLTSCFSKKQTALAIFTIEAEYVSAGKACQQALWMKQALINYDVRLDDVPIMCDNKGAIDLNKNPMQHSRTKHIEIRHQFLRDNVQKEHISIEKVSTVDNIADILTKPLKRESFNYLRLGLGMMKHVS
nr:copia protein [Tanacetum cinerariifolium]